MDYLSRLIHHLEGRKAIKAVSLHNNYNISHLLFADDILIFVEDNDTYINNFQVALSLFELASGLKFNMSKSIISPVNVFANKDESLVNLCGLTTQFLPVNYLGVTLGRQTKFKIFLESNHRQPFTRSWMVGGITRFLKEVGSLSSSPP